MKRCPECRRDYYDETLLYCLDDGAHLLDGPASTDEPATAILSEPPASAGGQFSESATRAQIHTTEGEQRSFGDSTEERSPSSNRAAKPLAALFVAVAVLVGGFFGYRYLKPSDSGQINSIAVLPFVNASGDQETDFLSDGLAETLINNFTKIPALRVTARSTAFRYKGRETEPQTVGKELNVDAILTGKVLLRGDSLTIQVDLIDASTGAQIWGNRYSGKPSEILNVQQDIARDVSQQLKLKLSGAQEQQIAKNYTTDPEAYQLYLKGRFYWNKRTAENLKKAIEQFKEATDKDPNYALAFVGLADCYALMEQYAGTPASETLPQAKAYAMRALAIDDSLAEAHVSLAAINHRSWEWAESEKEFKRAIAMNPNYSMAHNWYFLLLIDLGRSDEAAAEIRRQELDPLSNVIGTNISVTYLIRGDVNSAIESSRKMIDLDPNYGNAYQYLGRAYLKQGNGPEAIAAFERAVELNVRSGFSLSELGYGYAVTGKRDNAIATLKELEGKYAKREAIGQYVAAVFAGLGEKDEAFAWLEKDFQGHSGHLGSIRYRPAFETLRSDPRYADLLRRMSLPE